VKLNIFVILFFMSIISFHGWGQSDPSVSTSSSGQNSPEIKTIQDDKYGSISEEFVLYYNPDESLSRRAEVDLPMVFNTYDKTVDYDKDFEKDKKKKEQELRKIIEEIKVLQKEKRPSDEITKAVSLYKERRQELLAVIKQQRDELAKKIMDEIDNTIKEYGKKNQYKTIYSENMPDCREKDITYEILRILNISYNYN